MRYPRLGSFATITLLSLLMSGCTSAVTTSPTAALGTPEIVYAAIGASETYGTGADDRNRQAWPQVFFNEALPESAVFYNFGIPGATTAQALKDELPPALGIHPNLVTVWLNVNDLVQGVSPTSYGAQLQQLIHGLRRASSTRVLVANVPDLRQLPAFKACAPNAPDAGPACPIPSTLVPSADQMRALITAYNAVIAEVVKHEGATLVDLYSRDSVLAQHPDWISADGFHPSPAGYAVIAQAFADAYRTSG